MTHVQHHSPRPRPRHPLRTLAGHRRRTQRRHPRQGRTANPLLLRLWRPSLGRAHTTAERSQQILRLLGERAPRSVHEAQSCATEEFQRMSLMGGGRYPILGPQNEPYCRPPFYGAGLPLTRSLSKKPPHPFALGNLFQFLKWSGRSNRRGHPTPRQPVAGPATGICSYPPHAQGNKSQHGGLGRLQDASIAVVQRGYVDPSKPPRRSDW